MGSTVQARRRLAAFAAALLTSVAALIAAPVGAIPVIAWMNVLRDDPQPRDSAPSPSSNKTIAVDGSGNTYVTGYADDGTEDNILTIKYGPTGAVQWRAYASGWATAIAIDNTGNVYVVGGFRACYSLFNCHDYFQTLKYAPDGTELWQARSACGTCLYYAGAIAVDTNGNVYLTGSDPGIGNSTFVTIKYDPTGVERWRVSANQAGYGQGVAIAVDTQQSVFVLGRVTDGTIDGYLTIKYDALGSELWRATSINANDVADTPVALALDPNGDVVVTGTSWRQDQTTGFFTLKYNGATGTEQWRALETGPNPDPFHHAEPFGLAIDSAGNAYVTGNGGSSALPGFMTARYAPDGSEVWRVLTPIPAISTSQAGPRAIAVDQGGVYVTGQASNGSSDDYLTLKYDFAGEEVWRAWADNAWDSPTALAVDTGGNVFVTGYAYDTVANLFHFMTIGYDSGGTESWRAIEGLQPSAARLGLDPGSGGVYTPQGTHSLAVDTHGNAYVLGATSSGADGVHQLLTAKYDAGGTLLWRATYGGPINETIPGAVLIDATGNAYVTGLTPNYYTFLLKYDGTGSKQWAVPFNVLSVADLCLTANASAIDGAGNVYVSCSGVHNSPNLAPPEYLTLKLDSAGNILWRAISSAQAGITPSDPSSVAVDAAGNTYVTGKGSNGGQSFYVTVKYDAAGNEKWRATEPATDVPPTRAEALAVDSVGNVIVTGGALGDYLTIKYDTKGNVLWRAYGNVGHGHAGPLMVTTTAYALKLDSLGNIYITGRAGNGQNFDYATIKYNAAGVQQWVSIAKGAGNGEDLAFSLAVDAAGNAYVTGHSWNGSNYDILTIKYDTAGAEQWRMTGNNPLNDDFAGAVALAPDGSIYVTGTSTPLYQTMSIVLQKIVELAPATTILSTSMNPAPQGQTIAFTATVSGHKPSGTIDFLDSATTICAGVALVTKSKSSSSATCTTSSLGLGQHSITAAYSGDPTNAGSVSAPLFEVITIPPPGVTLGSSLNPAPPGMSVTFTATVTGKTPTGTVDFRDGSSLLCAGVALQGGGNAPSATCATAALSVGKHPISAAYSGDVNNPPITSSVLIQTVKRKRGH